jgi:hypothetical protein
MQKLLDLRLRLWIRSKKKKLPIQNMLESGLKYHKSNTKTKSDIPNNNYNSINILLNAVEYIIIII